MGKYAIFLVLALTFSLLTYSYALRNSIFISNERTVQSYSYNQAHNIAQGAAMIAINGIRNGEITYPYNTTNAWPEMNGEYTLDIYEDPDNNEVIVNSSGTFFENGQNTGATVNYEISIGLLSDITTSWEPEFDQAIHAEDKIDLSQGSQTFIDGDITLNGIGTNGIELGNQGGKIGGNLLIGPGGDPEKVIDNPQHYDKTPGIMDQTLDYKDEMPIFPDFPEGLPQADPENTIEFSTETLHYNNINVRGSSKLTINTGSEGDVLNIVTNSFVARSDIEIIGEGKLNLYVQNELDLSSSINATGKAEQMWIYYHGIQDIEMEETETIDVGGSAVYNGNLHADKANIRLRGTAEIRGHIITGGDSVELSGDVSVEDADVKPRAIFAPYATVTLNGRGSDPAKVTGSIISKEFVGNGNIQVHHPSDWDPSFPDHEIEISGYPIAWWN